MGNTSASGVWRLQDAKAQFSLVVDSALRGIPQHVSKRGKQAVVVVSEHDYLAMQRGLKAQAPSFIGHLLAMPKTPSEKPGLAVKASALPGWAGKPTERSHVRRNRARHRKTAQDKCRIRRASQPLAGGGREPLRRPHLARHSAHRPALGCAVGPTGARRGRPVDRRHRLDPWAHRGDPQRQTLHANRCARAQSVRQVNCQRLQSDATRTHVSPPS